MYLYVLSGYHQKEIGKWLESGRVAQICGSSEAGREMYFHSNLKATALAIKDQFGTAERF